MILRAKGISKSFGGVRAVQNVSIGVAEKSIFALIGPNGAGKSTLLNLLSGLYQPDAGSLYFDEKNLIGLPAHRRVRLGIARTVMSPAELPIGVVTAFFGAPFFAVVLRTSRRFA